MAVDSIAFEGDPIEAGRHVKMARKCLEALRAKLGGSGAETASTQMRLSDKAYVVAFIGPGIAKAVITAGYSAKESADSRYRAVTDVPDFLSGVALRSVLVEQEERPPTMESFWPTPYCATVFDLPSGAALNERLAIKPDDALEARWKQMTGVIRPAQTMRVVPTLYSGKMCQVVQMLLGFGKEPDRSRYDNEPPLLTKYGVDAARRQILPAYEQRVRSTGRRVLYDWSFARTHGITTAADDVLWLIEISVQSGVLAMPLPLNEVTQQDERFRQKLEALGDTPALTALEAFGGWPTGEAFPTGDALTQAIRAGYVQELLTPEDLEPLYDHHSPYSTAMGWSFNQRGSEAHVTAWRYESDRVQRGVWYAIQLSVGATITVEPAPEARGVIRRLDLAQIGGDEKRWLTAKANRMTRTQCQGVLAQSSTAAAVAMLRGITLDPIAQATGSVRQMQEGKLYWPGLYQPWIQFPEPMLGYCISHKMRQQFGPNISPAPRCETVVHVLHHGDILKTVSFLSDPRPAAPSDDDTFEECQYQGSWTRTTSTAPATVQPTMFTTDADDRADAHEYRETYTLTANAIGYTRVIVADDINYPPHGVMSRRRTFKRHGTTLIESGPRIGATVRVPFFDRSAYYYAYHYGWGTRSFSQTWVYVHLGDPHRYPTWRNFAGYTVYSRSGQPRSEHPAGCGPVTARTVWSESRSDYPCSEDADQGSWASVCDNADQMVYDNPLPPLPAWTSEVNVDRVDLTVMLYNASQLSPIQVDQRTQVGLMTNAVDQWSRTSPDPLTFEKQYIASTRNTLGDREQTQYDPHPNASEFRVAGGPLINELTRNQATYVGVVDG
jgi:hypothetical protein